eukprot:TRINITY_DN85_c0_g2_i2.p1 TRINITY_DN85_c0_g2~~TRINITY_DN85_c0_g2_i2.p1  ORF type:complete len:140 (+),score=38.47 TRINITY_DN85_c0_g2_i2:52-471(+)
MSGDKSIFTLIIEGTIPSTKLHETENTVTIMDINPRTKGHALVISKEEYNDIFDVPTEVLQEMALAAQTVAKAMKSGLDADGVNIVQNSGAVSGQEVIHIHIHVIPRYADDAGPIATYTPLKYADGEVDEIASKISSCL